MDTDRIDSVTVNAAVCAHSDSIVIEVRCRVDGSVRRRHKCRDCGERWTTINVDERPRQEPRKRVANGPPGRLTLEQVYQILTDVQSSNKRLAAEFGVSHQAIRLIRRGITWRHAFPELPRSVKRRSCLKCKHWDTNECAIGFPDPMEEGLGFAEDCEFYEV